MSRLAYESASGGEVISLDGPSLFADTALPLRGTQTSYKLSGRGAHALSRRAREVTLDVKSVDSFTLAKLVRAMDGDALSGTPGRLVVDGEWSTMALAVGIESKRITPWLSEIGVKLVLSDGAWRREARSEYMPATGSEGRDLDLPHDLPCDLLPPQPAVRVIVGGTAPAHFRLTVFGHAANPAVVIGGNRYQVDATVPSGGYMVVDSLAGTVEITDADGGVSNAFGAARRGTGSGGGEYIFERLRPGENAVSWDNSFGFALTVYEEEAAPPWS